MRKNCFQSGSIVEIQEIKAVQNWHRDALDRLRWRQMGKAYVQLRTFKGWPDTSIVERKIVHAKLRKELKDGKPKYKTIIEDLLKSMNVADTWTGLKTLTGENSHGRVTIVDGNRWATHFSKQSKWFFLQIWKLLSQPEHIVPGYQDNWSGTTSWIYYK